MDRVIQRPMAQALTPLFDPHFSTHSHGFRYDKRAHQAVRAVEAANAAGYTEAVDCDLKSFFDTMNHERLMNLVKQCVTDSRVLRLNSGNGIVQRALNNAWLKQQGVPDIKSRWIELHCGDRKHPPMDLASVNPTGTA